MNELSDHRRLSAGPAGLSEEEEESLKCAAPSSSVLWWLFSSTVMCYNELLAAVGAIYLSAILICKCDGLKQMTGVAFKWWK